MKVAFALGILFACAGPAQAASVDVLVLGRQQQVLAGPQGVTQQPRTVKVGSRRCAVGARTALSALRGTRLKLGLRDEGRCSRRARDAGGLYVRSIAGTAARGRAGWVYKVGRKLATTGAGDPSGPFGSGPIRAGASVTWFWCELRSNGQCPPTLETGQVREGDAVRVTVRAFDDFGRGRLVEGATVHVGDATAVTGADGTATLSGAGTVYAEKAGAIRSHPETI